MSWNSAQPIQPQSQDRIFAQARNSSSIISSDWSRNQQQQLQQQQQQQMHPTNGMVATQPFQNNTPSFTFNTPSSFAFQAPLPSSSSTIAPVSIPSINTSPFFFGANNQHGTYNMNESDGGNDLSLSKKRRNSMEIDSPLYAKTRSGTGLSQEIVHDRTLTMMMQGQKRLQEEERQLRHQQEQENWRKQQQQQQQQVQQKAYLQRGQGGDGARENGRNNMTSGTSNLLQHTTTKPKLEEAYRRLFAVKKVPSTTVTATTTTATAKTEEQSMETTSTIDYPLCGGCQYQGSGSFARLPTEKCQSCEKPQCESCVKTCRKCCQYYCSTCTVLCEDTLEDQHRCLYCEE